MDSSRGPIPPFPKLPPIPPLPPYGAIPPGMPPPIPPGMMRAPHPPPGMMPPGFPPPPMMMMMPPMMPPMMPRSSEPVHLTDETDPANWVEFYDKERKRPYFYNRKTKTTQWKKPPGFLSNEDKLKPVDARQIKDSDWFAVETIGGKTYYFDYATKETSWTLPDSIAEQSSEDESASTSDISEEDLEDESVEDEIEGEEGESEIDSVDGQKKKRKRKDSAASAEEESEPVDRSPKRRKGDEPEQTDASASASSTGTENLTYERRVAIFRELLREKGIGPTSKWSKSLPLIAYDPRFNILPTQAERRSAFDIFVRTRVAEEKKEKRAQMKVAQESFRKMLEELGDKITYKTTYEDVKELCRDDERWKTLDSKEREAVINEFIAPLKEQHKKAKAKAEAEFNQMLEEYGKITPDSRWGDVKKDLENDPRYNRGILSPDDREDLFRAFRKKLQKEEEAKRLKKEKEEQLRRQRERMLREAKADEERKLRLEREKLARTAETSDFRALLQERVHNHYMRWRDAIKLLESDSRYNTKYLTSSDKERLFEEHIRALEEQRHRQFNKLLADTDRIELTSEWDQIKPFIESDPRYKSVERDNQREMLFNRFMKELRRKAEADLIKLFDETKKFTRSMLKNKSELNDIIELLRGDKRWKRFDCMPETREKMLLEYIQEHGIEAVPER